MSRLFGDVTNNGSVDIGDVVYIASALAQLPGYTLPSVDIADVTGNGEIDIGDVVYIASALAQLPGYEIPERYIQSETGKISVEAKYYESLGTVLGSSLNGVPGVQIVLSSDKDCVITGFDLRFKEDSVDATNSHYVKLSDEVNFTPGITATTLNNETEMIADGNHIFNNSSDWYVTENTSNHPTDGLTRINGFTGQNTQSGSTNSFTYGFNLVANTPKVLMNLISSTANPELVYCDLVKDVGGLLYNDDESPGGVEIVSTSGSGIVTTTRAISTGSMVGMNVMNFTRKDLITEGELEDKFTPAFVKSETGSFEKVKLLYTENSTKLNKV